MFRNITGGLNKMSISDIKAATGCINHCKYTRYQAKATTTRVTEYNKTRYDPTEFILQISDPNIQHFEDIRTYDFGSLTADFGGFLGLLLGLSCMDVFPFLQKWFEFLRKRKFTAEI